MESTLAVNRLTAVQTDPQQYQQYPAPGSAARSILIYSTDRRRCHSGLNSWQLAYVLLLALSSVAQKFFLLSCFEIFLGHGSWTDGGFNQKTGAVSLSQARVHETRAQSDMKVLTALEMVLFLCCATLSVSCSVLFCGGQFASIEIETETLPPPPPPSLLRLSPHKEFCGGKRFNARITAAPTDSGYKDV